MLHKKLRLQYNLWPGRIIKRSYAVDFQAFRLRESVSAIERKLQIYEKEDWYDIPSTHISAIPGKKALLSTYGTVKDLVYAAHPQHAWDETKFAGVTAGQYQQRLMERVIRHLFPGMDSIRNCRNHGLDIRNPKTGKPVEIDLFFPRLMIGFEYQEAHHYFTSTYGVKQTSQFRDEDYQKLRMATAAGLTLFQVPFWWDNTPESLACTILAKKPGLAEHMRSEFVKSAKSRLYTIISAEPPPHVTEKYELEIPEFGVPMLVMQMPVTRNYVPDGWLISEKYDGIRGVWHPPLRQVYSRRGNPFPIAEFITGAMPPTWIDGEIWFGRQKRTSSFLISTAVYDTEKIPWDEFNFLVFELPCTLLSSRQRVIKVEEIVPFCHPFISSVPHITCQNREHVQRICDEIRQEGGEGVIIQHPRFPYSEGHSPFMFKFKSFLDEEGKVISKVHDGVYVVRIPKRGEQFAGKSEPFSTFEVNMPIDKKYVGDPNLKEGDIVSYRFYGTYSKYGKPINPMIYQARPDIDWESVKRNALAPLKRQLKQSPIWKPPMIKYRDHTIQRRFFDQLAIKLNINPKDPTDWYTKISRQDVLNVAGGPSILTFRKSLRRALIDLYPELKLEMSGFMRFHDLAARRKFFEDFARKRGFDASKQPKEWLKVSKDDLRLEKGFHSVISYHGQSMNRALTDCFPEVELFSRLGKWDDTTTWRKFFDDVALGLGLDPSKASDWFTISKDKITELGGGVILRLAGSYKAALQTAYPDLDIQEVRGSSSKWGDDARQRLYFDGLARRKGFDPMNAQGWYFTCKKDFGEVQSLLYQKYSGSYQKALMHLYPEHRLQKSKWDEMRNDIYRSEMLANFQEQHG